MIYLITGLPGNGKTLYTIWHVLERSKAEQRPVFYSGIPNLALDDWQEFEPEKWFECPPGSIIVIDEAQRVFRPRPGRGQPPEHVERLETHRHDGHDIYLITQHPSLIDQNVRRLAGTHRHIVRTFGMNRAVIHEWGEVHLDCERRREDSSRTNWSYPKDVFKLYKSAEVHTHKRSFPKQVYWLLGILAVFILTVYHLVTRATEITTKEDSPPSPSAQAPVSTSPAFPQGLTSNAPRVRTRADYIADYTPRLDGFPHTAPAYDSVTAPERAPYPTGCAQTPTSCRCYTQDGTVIPMTPDSCRAILANGFFRAFPEITEKREAP